MPLAGQGLDPLAGHPRYRKLQDLNSGAFGFVQLCKNTQTGELVAIKFIERGDRVNKYVEGECLNHHMLRHPHVIEFKEVFLTDDYLCIAMEYASGGNLFTYVQRAGRLKEPAARWFFQQLIIGLDYIHRKGVVNRDIKLENTLLHMVQGLPLPLLKVCDFGYSKAKFMSQPKSKVGTLAYMSPEVLNASGFYDGKQADIWSCGVMLYVMLFGQYPFESPNQVHIPEQQRIQTMKLRITHLQWSIPAEVPISSECRDLLYRLLDPDPRRRATMLDISKHAWFLQNLPNNALEMNQEFLSALNQPVQSVTEIVGILGEAQKPKHDKFLENEGDLIDAVIDDEMGGSHSDAMPNPVTRGIAR